MYPFERFTEDAKKTFTLAQEEAERSHHSYIGTEHLLLGLLRVPSGTAHMALRELGIDIKAVRQTIDAVLGRDERTIIQQIVPTARVKKVIEIAFEEARRMGTHYVDSGHILIALTIEGEGIAAHVLENLGAGQKQVIAAVERAVSIAPTGHVERARPARPQMGSTPMLASMRPETASGSDGEILLRLLRKPHVANLLRAKGLVDLEGLAAKLGEPPPEIIRLRLQVQDLRNQLRIAAMHQRFDDAGRIQKQEMDLLKKLERAEQDWLRKLTE